MGEGMKPLRVIQAGHIDPVCGMTVDPERAAGRSEHGGKTIYFCAAGCKRRFDENPSAYLPGAEETKAPAPPPAPVPPGTMYVCPMDPEVRQARPGACPKCGMALEPEVV